MTYKKLTSDNSQSVTSQEKQKRSVITEQIQKEKGRTSEKQNKWPFTKAISPVLL